MAKDSNNNEDEIVYIAVKDESDNDEEDKMALISHERKNDTWIIDSGCSHHMTGDKKSLNTLKTMMVVV